MGKVFRIRDEQVKSTKRLTLKSPDRKVRKDRKAEFFVRLGNKTGTKRLRRFVPGCFQKFRFGSGRIFRFQMVCHHIGNFPERGVVRIIGILHQLFGQGDFIGANKWDFFHGFGQLSGRGEIGGVLLLLRRGDRHFRFSRRNIRRIGNVIAWIYSHIFLLSFSQLILYRCNAAKLDCL